jgi:hypothetical protein
LLLLLSLLLLTLFAAIRTALEAAVVAAPAAVVASPFPAIFLRPLTLYRIGDIFKGIIDVVGRGRLGGISQWVPMLLKLAWLTR